MASGRKKLVFGNWKMNFSFKQAQAFAQKLSSKDLLDGVEVAVGPHSLALGAVSETLAESEISVIAQNAYYKDDGAFTGEISMPMLRGIAKYVVIGHSERRHIFHESNDLIRAKMAAALRSGIKPILCVGETLLEREHLHTSQILSDQLSVGLADLTSEEVGKIIIAYEPVWAIGTGKYAKPDEAEKMIAKIRSEISSLYGYDAANKVRILYGGSVNAHNSGAYLKLDGIDGLFVGGASLSIATFWPMIELAAKAFDEESKKGKK